VGNTAKEGVQNTHCLSGRTEIATENKTGQALSHRHCSSYLSVALSVGPDRWCMSCTPSLAEFRTRCNQMNSNLAYLDAAVKVG